MKYKYPYGVIEYIRNDVLPFVEYPLSPLSPFIPAIPFSPLGPKVPFNPGIPLSPGSPFCPIPINQLVFCKIMIDNDV